MKKAMAAALVAVLLASVPLVSCAVVVVRGSGNMATNEYNFSDFTRVEVGSAFQVDIEQSDSYSVSVTADDNLFSYISVYKQGKTLKMGLKTAQFVNVTIKAKITIPQLSALDLSGAVQGTVSGFSSTENMDIKLSGASVLKLVSISLGDVEFDVSGASHIDGDITANDVNFDLSGASSVQVLGSASDIVVDASGACYVLLDNFAVNNADVSLSGASTGVVNMDGRLDADLSDASRLRYIGEPTMGQISTSGDSTLSQIFPGSDVNSGHQSIHAAANPL